MNECMNEWMNEYIKKQIVIIIILYIYILMNPSTGSFNNDVYTYIYIVSRMMHEYNGYTIMAIL